MDVQGGIACRLGAEAPQAWDDAVQHILLSLQKTIRSVPPSPVLVILVICISTRTAKKKKPYLTISLAQTMILVPVSSPTSQPVGCVRVKDAVQVCGVRLMPARHNTGQLGTDLFRMHSMA